MNQSITIGTSATVTSKEIFCKPIQTPSQLGLRQHVVDCRRVPTSTSCRRDTACIERVPSRRNARLPDLTNMCREWERSMSVWCGTRPGTRAGCRKRRASSSTCCELPFHPEASTLRAKFNLLRFDTGSENMMATARLRPQMMRLTDAAANRIKSVMANAGRPIVGPRRQSRVSRG